MPKERKEKENEKENTQHIYHFEAPHWTDEITRILQSPKSH
jgi:hypothetical protein